MKCPECGAEKVGILDKIHTLKTNSLGKLVMNWKEDKYQYIYWSGDKTNLKSYPNCPGRKGSMLVGRKRDIRYKDLSLHWCCIWHERDYWKEAWECQCHDLHTYQAGLEFYWKTSPELVIKDDYKLPILGKIPSNIRCEKNFWKAAYQHFKTAAENRLHKIRNVGERCKYAGSLYDQNIINMMNSLN